MPWFGGGGVIFTGWRKTAGPCVTDSSGNIQSIQVIFCLFDFFDVISL